MHTYNNAVDEINPKLSEINKKYKTVDLVNDDEAYERYHKECNKMFDEVFDKHFQKDYGEMMEISGLGKNWITEHGMSYLGLA